MSEARTLMDLQTVGEVSAEIGVTVRTLHHYDEIGLLVPSERSFAGYRLYTEADLARLQHVVVYRRLGFSLDEVAELLAEPDDLLTHLRRQRASLIDRVDQLQRLVSSIDTAIEVEMTGSAMSAGERHELFGSSFDDEYAAEAEHRWGDTDAWEHSRKRTAGYGPEQWRQVKADTSAVESRFAELLSQGAAADGAAAMDTAERARQDICRWFYDCPPQMHAALAEMYVGDPRFEQHYEGVTPGLARFVRDAVVANAVRQQQ